MLLAFTGSGSAHPLGNFSISQYSAIRIVGNEIEFRYMIDMAEIPTFQEIQESGIVPKTGDPSLEAYLTRKSELLRDGLTLEVNGKRLPLRAESREIIFPPGAGGLPTMKIGILYKAKLTGDSKNREYLLSYRDGNFPGSGRLERDNRGCSARRQNIGQLGSRNRSQLPVERLSDGSIE